MHHLFRPTPSPVSAFVPTMYLTVFTVTHLTLISFTCVFWSVSSLCLYLAFLRMSSASWSIPPCTVSSRKLSSTRSTRLSRIIYAFFSSVQLLPCLSCASRFGFRYLSLSRHVHTLFANSNAVRARKNECGRHRQLTLHPKIIHHQVYSERRILLLSWHLSDLFFYHSCWQGLNQFLRASLSLLSCTDYWTLLLSLWSQVFIPFLLLFVLLFLVIFYMNVLWSIHRYSILPVISTSLHDQSATICLLNFHLGLPSCFCPLFLHHLRRVQAKLYFTVSSRLANVFVLFPISFLLYEPLCHRHTSLHSLPNTIERSWSLLTTSSFLKVRTIMPCQRRTSSRYPTSPSWSFFFIQRLLSFFTMSVILIILSTTRWNSPLTFWKS